MSSHRAAVYYSWSRPAEITAPLSVIEDRFPALFESRRLLYPRLQELSDPVGLDQGISGFIDYILKKNFSAFVEQTSSQTGQPVVELERVQDDGREVTLDDALSDGVDTLFVISFDSLRTCQQITETELDAVRAFLDEPKNLLVVSLHHDVGQAGGLSGAELAHGQEVDFLHHGDRTLPPRQGFGGFGRSLLGRLGVPVQNRYGLRPAVEPDGSPTPIEIAESLDRANFLDGVRMFNLHPHLPHLERLGDATEKMDVIVRQRIDLSAPPHPFTQNGRSTFDALLQSQPGIFAGVLLVTDATLWSSTAGGTESLRRLWSNIIGRADQRADSIGRDINSLHG
jgi:hypothetical protein